MEIPVSCSCGKKFRAKPALAGKTVPCPGCKSPISIPAQSATPQSTSPAPGAVPQQQSPLGTPPGQPASPPVPLSPAPSGEILVACNCGQQFKVEAQFAGHQVNCPTCQTLCVIPAANQPAPSAFPQPMPPQPIGQQPMQQPGMPGQPFPPQQSAFPPNPGYAAQPQYQEPSYGGGYGRKPSYKTGLGIFIFAIAATVFAGGFGLKVTIELIFAIAAISGAGLYSALNFLFVVYKIGAIARMLGILATVVAAVFCMLSPQPLFGLGIGLICVAATGAVMLSFMEVIPLLQNSMDLLSLLTDPFVFLMVRWMVIGTFLMGAIYMLYALKSKKLRYGGDFPKWSIIGFSVCAGVITLVIILASSFSDLGIRSVGGMKAFTYFIGMLYFVSHAAMIIGLVFLIRCLFDAKKHFKI